MQAAATFALIAVSAAAQSPRLAEFDRRLPATRTRAACSAAADFDADGNPDLLVAGPGQAVELFAARGNGGRFVTIPSALTTNTRPVQMAAADFDDDGSLDVYLAAEPVSCLGLACTQGRDLVLWNDGRGGFDLTSRPQPPVAADSFTRAVSVGDIDGDGSPDVLLAIYPRVWVPCAGCAPQTGPSMDVLLRNDGNGSFAPVAASPLTATASFTECATLIDLDVDGDLDALVSRRLAHGFDPAEDRIYWNDGSGRFSPPTIAAMARPARELRAADLDGDGDRDLIRVDDAGLQVYEVTAAGPVLRPQAVPASLGPCSDVRTGDWDGDGIIDLSVRQEGTATPTRVVPLFGSAAGLAFGTRPGTQVASQARHPHHLDADRDGDLDLVLLSATTADHELRFNDGTGRWRQAPAQFANGQDSWRDAATGDFDGDGDLDVAVAAALPGRNQWLTNDGWGDLAPIAAGDFSTIRADTVGLAAGDVDGDGDLDLVTANRGGPIVAEPARLYANDGAGQFTASALPIGDTLDVALGDLDGDGDLDLVFAGFGGTSVLFNGGALGFAQPVLVPGSGVGSKISLVDSDGDGDLDALTTAFAGLGTQLLRNDGSGRLAVDLTALPLFGDDSVAHSWGDVDGDGDPDLLIANDGGAFPQRNRLLRNAGNGTFAAAPYPGDASRTAAVHLVDLDGDGDLDAVEVAFETGPGLAQTRVLENNGSGGFRPLANGAPRAPATAYRYAFGDFDRDGDPDGLLLGDGPLHVHSNLRRHISARELPRLGRPLVIDLYGAAGQSAAIAAAPLAATTIIPQGVLGLDPNWAQVLLAGSVPPSGTMTLNLPIPNSPSLLGVVLYWQGITGPPDRLTNRMTTRLARY